MDEICPPPPPPPPPPNAITEIEVTPAGTVTEELSKISLSQ
jgi:hypothetical protein